MVAMRSLISQENNKAFLHSPALLIQFMQSTQQERLKPLCGTKVLCLSFPHTLENDLLQTAAAFV